MVVFNKKRKGVKGVVLSNTEEKTLNNKSHHVELPFDDNKKSLDNEIKELLEYIVNMIKMYKDYDEEYEMIVRKYNDIISFYKDAMDQVTKRNLELLNGNITLLNLGTYDLVKLDILRKLVALKLEIELLEKQSINKKFLSILNKNIDKYNDQDKHELMQLIKDSNLKNKLFINKDIKKRYCYVVFDLLLNDPMNRITILNSLSNREKEKIKEIFEDKLNKLSTSLISEKYVNELNKLRKLIAINLKEEFLNLFDNLNKLMMKENKKMQELISMIEKLDNNSFERVFNLILYIKDLPNENLYILFKNKKIRKTYYDTVVKWCSRQYNFEYMLSDYDKKNVRKYLKETYNIELPEYELGFYSPSSDRPDPIFACFKRINEKRNYIQITLSYIKNNNANVSMDNIIMYMQDCYYSDEEMKNNVFESDELRDEYYKILYENLPTIFNGPSLLNSMNNYSFKIILKKLKNEIYELISNEYTIQCMQEKFSNEICTLREILDSKTNLFKDRYKIFQAIYIVYMISKEMKEYMSVQVIMPSANLNNEKGCF